MVAPITGPTVQSVSFPFASLTRSRYRQAKPYNLPLPYTSDYRYGMNVSSDYSGFSSRTKQTTFTTTHFADYNKHLVAARNKCYDKLKSKFSDQAGWAENLAQITKTRDSFVGRCVQLGRFTTALRSGDFSRAARVLRSPVPGSVSRRKGVAQNFLEWEYGWKPLLNDLDSSWNILCGDPGERPIEAATRATVFENINQITGGGNSGTSLRDFAQADLRVSMGALVRVTNPNLFLANQLGLIDLALPWKLLPFSFVIDWFVNVEQCISSYTDWFGCQLTNQWSNTYVRMTRTSRSYTYWMNGVTPAWSKTDLDQDSILLQRATTIPGPTLQVKPFQGFSLERGAQAISLVLSVLGK